VGLMTATAFPYLTTLVLLPSVGAGVVALIPRRAVATWFHEAVGVAVTVLTLGVAAGVLVVFKAGTGAYQMVSTHEWASGLGIHWSVGVDGISLFLVVLTAVLFPLTMLGARARRDPRAFVAWVLLLESGVHGQLRLARPDPVLPLLRADPGPVVLPDRWVGVRPARLRGDQVLRLHVRRLAFLLVGIVSIAFIHQSRPVAHLRPAGADAHPPVGTEGVLLFLAFTAAFAVKAPIFPFHTWSPDAYAESPTAAAILLVAVMAKLGTYGIIRFDLNLFPRPVAPSPRCC